MVIIINLLLLLRQRSDDVATQGVPAGSSTPSLETQSPNWNSLHKILSHKGYSNTNTPKRRILAQLKWYQTKIPSQFKFVLPFFQRVFLVDSRGFDPKLIAVVSFSCGLVSSVWVRVKQWRNRSNWWLRPREILIPASTHKTNATSLHTTHLSHTAQNTYHKQHKTHNTLITHFTKHTKHCTKHNTYHALHKTHWSLHTAHTAVLNPKYKLQKSKCYTLSFEQNRWLTTHTHNPLHRLPADCLGCPLQFFSRMGTSFYGKFFRSILYSWNLVKL